MTELFENIQKPETAVLVGVDLGEYDCEASLDELEELAKTAGAKVEARVTQRRETPDSATFIGSNCTFFVLGRLSARFSSSVR